MGYTPPAYVPTPIGFADFASYQTAVIAAFPPCPPPYDPTCENVRDALIAAALELWTTDPNSCGVVVCDASGQPIHALPANPGPGQPGYSGQPGAPSAIASQPLSGSGLGGALTPSSQPSSLPASLAAPPVRPIVAPPRGGKPAVIGAAGPVLIGLGGPVGIVIGIATVIGGILGGLFGGLFGGQDYGQQIEQLKQAMVDIGNALTAAIAAVMHAMGAILRFLQGIWDNILHAIIDLLKKVVEQLGHLYRDILPKIADWVRKIRDRILQIYERLVRPLILILMRVHTILRILAAFHIKWAARLDQQLQQLQSLILKPILWLLGQINGIVNVLNWILDLKMLIQRTLMINSLFATAGTWTKMFYNVQTGATTYDQISASADAQRPPDLYQTQADAQQFRDTGSGPFAELIAVSNNQALQIKGGGV